MNFIFLTQVTGILRPFAWIMGKILNLIYLLVEWMGIPNIAVCIILFTIVIKMLMLPLTIKQQKTAKVSARMQPEIQAIQEKYRGVDRSDRNAMMRMTEEQQAVYRKYGTSPFGGCLPLILMFIIIFALYRVIYAIPAYVPQVKDLYKPVSSAVMKELGESELVDGKSEILLTEDATAALKEFLTVESLSVRSSSTRKASRWNEDQLIDALSVFSTTAWEDFLSGKVMYTEDKYNETQVENGKCKKWNELCRTSAFLNAVSAKDEAKEDILRINSVFGKYSVLDPPGWKLTPMLLIPILAAVLQYLQTKLSMSVQKSGDNNKKNENNMAGSMEGMMKIMPVVSGVFCVFFPIGVGIYWVMNSAVSILQQAAINKRLDKLSIDDIVAANEAKEAERVKKLGIVASGNQTSSIAKTSTKTISVVTENKEGGKSKSKENDKRPAQKVSDRKRDELSKNAAEGKSNISAIANLYRNDDGDGDDTTKED
ncbi:MAG: YidC/Oxa1 family membrane protein insertase [Lachnospiraceae bacterium]|nr:YidC/Oxa1 family membrane protein insertase [Lachnospiraceae bacterium]